MFPHILLQSSQTLSGLKTEASDFIKVQSVKIKNWDVWWACMLGTYSVYTHGISHFYISHVLLLKTSQALTLFLELLLDGFSVICCCYIPGTCFTGSVPDIISGLVIFIIIWNMLYRPFCQIVSNIVLNTCWSVKEPCVMSTAKTWFAIGWYTVYKTLAYLM